MNDCQCLCVIVISLYVSTVVLESAGNGKGCYYKGSYHHGNWTDGCEFNCTCLDAEKGHYKCHTRCPVYPQLPTGCVLKLPSGEECCKQPDCSAITSHYNNNNNTSNSTNGDNDETSEKTMILNNTITDSSIDNEEERGCLYNGKYHHGNWTDGCEFNCSCEDPVLGIYRCRKRCRAYTELDPGCILKQSSTDECCRVPVCNSTDALKNMDNNTSEIKTTIKAIILTTLPPVLPDFMGLTSKKPTSVDNANNVAYKAVSESNKSKNNNKEIITAKQTEKLAIIFSRFGPIRLFTVRQNINKKFTTPNELNNGTETADGVQREVQNLTRNGKREFNDRNHRQMQNTTGTEGLSTENYHLKIDGVCLYKGMNFTQGEQWYDGCDIICTCENATQGFYKCRSRCQKYHALPIGCFVRRSEADGCCLIPDCRFATVTKSNQQIVSSRILPEDGELGKTQKSMLKRLFNQRIQMRNKLPQTEKDKMVTIKGKHKRHHNIEQGNIFPSDSSLTVQKQIYINDLQREMRLLETLVPSSDVGIQKTSQRQEIVTPYSVKESDIVSESNISAENVENESRGKNESYRTIATETGIYKVRKRDGIISAYRKPMSNVLKRTVEKAVPGKSVSGFCDYKNKRFHKGETWFDGCELACVCHSNGKYSCHNRCPVYSRIPDGCYLVKPRVGLCCSLLICRRNPSRNHPPASYSNL